jgi:type IV pilus assembly protein PilY1
MKLKELVLTAALTALAGLGSPQASAAPADLADVPLVSGVSKVVPPNIYFILDDSTSMNWEFMPDAAWGNGSQECFKNFGYNQIYYNPNVTYVPPKRADGTDFPNSTFTAAWRNGFDASEGTINLSSQFRAYYTGDGRSSAAGGGPGSNDAAQAAYYHRYNANPANPPSTCANNNAYSKVTVGAAERQNFANWYSYYRTRMLTMKSAAGRAFTTVNDTFRVGFVTINERNPSNASTRFLKLDTFQGAHRNTWYSRLYDGGCPSGDTCYTPLRGALSRAGQYYAGKIAGLDGADDPIQYSCQQNFSILTTDGYWNTSGETAAHGPKMEDNATNVGDQDGVAGTVRPYLDAGQYTNSLADVAMYYYKTDLRPAAPQGVNAAPDTTGGLLDDGVTQLDVTTNNVPVAGSDTANHQHMTTFTLGLGVSGQLVYADNYLAGGSADYNAILQGTKNWPNPQTGSNASTVVTRVDDLWHAAVNGRGQYLSAESPDALVSALTRTLAAISVKTASASAAATSSLEPVAGDNYAYVAQYTTGQWHGDLQAREIDLVTGALSPDVEWSARQELDARVDDVSDTRRIFTFDGAAADNLKEFTSDNLAAEIAANYFKPDGSNPDGALTQFGTWNAAQVAAATDEAMINFIRGQSGNEDDDGSGIFRDRTHALGDVVNTAPVYVGKPKFRYGDAGYAAFANSMATRDPVVYVGANDGMLHAFDGETGEELWAYIPSVVIPKLYKLADAGYGNNHQFFVDGPITVGDAFDTGDDEWKTVLVGGLGRGARAVYALDVTDPDDPKALWEFGVAQDNDIGYSYGNPVLTKRASDGRWVVAFASGYNNTSSGGDGKGRLYVLDAFTGAKLQEIITSNAVTDPNVSGIAKINNFVASSLVDNSTQYVYGGDLGGSLWSFDLTAGTSQRLGRTSSVVGDMPITVRPELARVKDGNGVLHRVVYFGTGRYLGLSDLDPDSPSATVAQAMFAVKDTRADLGVLTDDAALLVEQTMDVDDTPRTISDPQPVDWAVKNGWYLYTPVGERMNVDPRLQLGTFVIVANEPDEDYCTVGGVSWLYTVDYKSGAAVITQHDMAVGQPVGNSIATGLTLIRLPTNKLIAVVTQADTTVRAMDVPAAPGVAGEARRVGWSELY